MKLIIQIPCFNEEKSLPITLPLIPKKVTGFNKVEILIIDDGSIDQTAAVAQKYGVDHIVSLGRNQGLARAFTAGINACLDLGADVIVNIDADNQYNAQDIEKLTDPILTQKADITIGVRPIDEIPNFSKIKKFLQKFGSDFIHKVSKVDIKDATSGFRAISREAALRLNIFTKYTYTLEMILQANEKQITIVNIPIKVNPVLRPSRLVKSTLSYVLRSAKTIIDVLMIYNAFRFFFVIGSLILFLGILIGTRYFWFMWIGEGKGHVQSVILSATFMVIGSQVILLAFLARGQSVNRRILEDIQYHLRKKS